MRIDQTILIHKPINTGTGKRCLIDLFRIVKIQTTLCIQSLVKLLAVRLIRLHNSESSGTSDWPDTLPGHGLFNSHMFSVTLILVLTQFSSQ